MELHTEKAVERAQGYTMGPEGSRILTEENRAYLSSRATLERAMQNGVVREGTAILCDGDHTLTVDLG